MNIVTEFFNVDPVPGRVRIPNDSCTPEIDVWLKENVGPGNWAEYFGFTALPYRSFSFRNDKHKTMFILRFL